MFLSSASPAGAEDVRARRNRLRRQLSQLRIQLDLAISSDTAVQKEVNRLDGAVVRERSALDAAQAAQAAAQERVAAINRRIADLTARGDAARHALVARAIELYEHPFRTASVILNGVHSISELAERQALLGQIEANTVDLIDAVRQRRLELLDAKRGLDAAESEARQRAADVADTKDGLSQALASQQRIHSELQKRIDDLVFETRGLAEQEGSLEALIEAQDAAYAAQVARAESAAISSHIGGLIWPVHGPVTREFGYQPGGFHPGIDIAPPYGTPIHASAFGVVVFAGWEGGYGNYTCIDHGRGLSTCYAHQSQIQVSVGQSVVRGQVIGLEGSTGNSTGPHVHFETRVNGKPQNPRDFVRGSP